MLGKQYTVSSGDIVSENFDGDIVVLDLSCGKYFSFTDCGCVLWEAVTAGIRPQALLGGTLTAGEMESFVSKLIASKLIALRTEPVPALPVDAVAEKLLTCKELPDLFVFDDLAELFLADPIHDVEEPAGWPVLREQA
jgi:hypothetical protein